MGKFPQRRWVWVTVVAVLSALLPPLAQATVPSGFEDTLVTKLTVPTAIAFTPDGRMLITTKRGQVRVFKNGVLLPTPALDFTARVCSDRERGMLGIAVDPDFASTHHVFIYYTFKNGSACGTPPPPDAPINRVSRFTLRDDDKLDPASERVLLDGIPSPGAYHNAGGVYFGNDNFLYVSVGDGGCDYAGDSGCAGSNDAARDQHVLLGKVLRITSSGSIPTSNPFRGANSARCNVTGRTDAGKICQETFARGLRNPFRLAFDSDAESTRFFINDVGQEAWEEINEGRPGADYGWNVREGHCATNSTTNCGPPPAGMTNPIYDYGHSSGCAAITGGAFVPDGVWPDPYDDQYLFGDYVCGRIQALRASSPGYAATGFATDLGAIIDMGFGPWGSTQALYYIVYPPAGGGDEIRRIAYTGNRAPVAVAEANPQWGAAPLTVNFDGRASRDPDGEPITYRWDFGDGTPVATTPAVSHTYTVAGTYDATLRVTDGHGAAVIDGVRVDVGNTPPRPSIETPIPSVRFRVGQPITLRGSANDSEDGALPASALSWTVLLHHNTHTHPFLGPVNGNDVAFTTPPPEDLQAAATSYLELRLTATDSKGRSTTVSQNLMPNTVPLTFIAEPSGPTLKLDGVPVTPPRTVTSWEGYEFVVDAEPVQGRAGMVYSFRSWSDGGAIKHTIRTGNAATTYTANFNSAKCGGGVGVGILLAGLVSLAGRWRSRYRRSADEANRSSLS